MKRIIALLLTIVLVLSSVTILFSCGQKEGGTDTTDTGTSQEGLTRDVQLPTELPQLEGDAVAIHYQRSDEKYASWALWLWDPEGIDDNEVDQFNYMDDYGVIAYYPLSKFGDLSGQRLGVIIRKQDSWTKDGTDADRYIDFKSLVKDEQGIYHIYLVGNDANLYTSKDKVVVDSVSSAAFVSDKSISVSGSNAIDSIVLYANGEKVADINGAGKKTVTFTIPSDVEVSFSTIYTVDVVFRGTGATVHSDVGMDGLYSSDVFNELYYYDGTLGAIWTTTQTEFKVWSPIAYAITLRIYESGTPTSVSSTLGNNTHQDYVMEKGEKGVWSYTLSGNQEGKYYTYVVKTPTYPDGKEIVDPYARSTGVNGVRGMVVDFSKTNPDGWDTMDYLTYDRLSLTVYETHVADVTSSTTWGGSTENQRKFLGLIETGTTYTENGVTVTTGFDHIKELGVNAIQLIPIFDQANDEVNVKFNWGYNPLNYNAVEGCYSSNPYDGYVKIRELKQVIQAFNQAGITTIMDVVYNHVNGATGSNFDVLMPGYYFRYTTSGALSNGSGCGNETASENAMMRKFMIDSVTFWMEEYKLGGFRFDLMGLHDIETMNALEAALEEINPYCVVYGEPWMGGTSTLKDSESAKQSNTSKFVGYGQFNDQMRDALIKGGLNGPTDKGWITNNTSVSNADVSKIIDGINGATTGATKDPNKTVNYVTCHDNYTLYDRIVASGTTDEDTIRKMAVLANSVVFTSNGTTFMLAGEEMLRTKGGNSNSYNASYQVNELDYSLKIKNLDVFENYQALLSFKQTCTALQQDEPNVAVEKRDNGSVLVYTLTTDTQTYLVIHSNGAEPKSEIATEGYTVYLDTLGLYEGSISQVTPAPYETLILVKNN